MIKKHYIKKNILHKFIAGIIILILLFLGIFNFDKLRTIKKNISPSQIANPLQANDKYLLLVNELSQNQVPITSLNYTNSTTVEASLSSGTSVIFSLDKDIISAVTSLQLILSRFKIEGRKVKKIDLRFKNAVIE